MNATSVRAGPGDHQGHEGPGKGWHQARHRCISPVDDVGEVTEEGAPGRDRSHVPPALLHVPTSRRLPSLPHVPRAGGAPRGEESINCSVGVAVPTRAPTILLEEERTAVQLKRKKKK